MDEDLHCFLQAFFIYREFNRDMRQLRVNFGNWVRLDSRVVARVFMILCDRPYATKT